MKPILGVCVGLVMVISPLVRAQDEQPVTPRFIRATIEQSEKSLLLGLDKTTDAWMLTTAARTMQQLKELYPERSFSSFTIPLMRIVKNEDLEPSARVMAAIALHNLKSSMGDFAIKQTARFTDSERVKHICLWLTYYQEREETAPEIVASTLSAQYAVVPLPEQVE